MSVGKNIVGFLWMKIQIVVITAAIALALQGCALVKTTRCADIEAKGVNIMEPMTGTFFQLGTLKYRRVAAPENYTGIVNCPEFAASPTQPKATIP